jgi:ribonucleoside-diphosphate reductase alpha chain
MRRRLNDTRESITHKFNVAGHEGYLIAGLYEDGRPGELFITMAKEGSTIGGLMDSLGTAVSVALQYGVPVESLVNKFAHQRFEPMGMTTNSDIPFAKSLVDYIFRWLGMQFIPGYREQNSPRRGMGAHPEPAPAISDTRKEEACAQGTSIGQGSGQTAAQSNIAASGWATRRENALEAVKLEAGRTDFGRSERSDTSPTTSPTTRVVTSHSVAAISETTIGGTRVIEAVTAVERTAKTVAANALDASNAALMGDAPACDGCGSITVRNGTCYRCLNCGNSMGCS